MVTFPLIPFVLFLFSIVVGTFSVLTPILYFCGMGARRVLQARLNQLQLDNDNLVIRLDGQKQGFNAFLKKQQFLQEMELEKQNKILMELYSAVAQLEAGEALGPVMEPQVQGIHKLVFKYRQLKRHLKQVALAQQLERGTTLEAGPSTAPQRDAFELDNISDPLVSEEVQGEVRSFFIASPWEFSGFIDLGLDFFPTEIPIGLILLFKLLRVFLNNIIGGWLLCYMHANGASMFFTAVYIHIFRGLYYGSYTSPREFIWCLGVVILLLMIVTAFIGYVLPWGQMSFWGATVITSLASAVPKVGNTIVTWLWGGFSVDNATLNRFFSLHYLLPFAIAGVSLIHLAALHQYGSNNPLGIKSSMDKIAFYPYFYVKDLVGWVAFAIFFSIWLFYAPNVLGHPDNYMPANPMSTPAHIVPEWYFLPIYAVLRSIPNKLGGVAAIGLVFVSLLALPFLNISAVRSSSFRPIHQRMFCCFLFDCLLLGWIGCQPVEAPYVIIGQMASAVFFLYFIIMFFLYKIEKVLRINETMSNNKKKEKNRPTKGDEKEEKKTEFGNTLICVIPVFDFSYLGGLLDLFRFPEPAMAMVIAGAAIGLVCVVFTIFKALPPIPEERERKRGCCGCGLWEILRKWFGI